MASQRPVVELFYDGAWHDHGCQDVNPDAYTRIASEIQINRGRGDEEAEPAASSLGLTFDNRTKWADPSNPLSPLYGLAGLNTPNRLWLPDAVNSIVDTFSRTASNTWNNPGTDSGHTYSHVSAGGGGLNDFDVAGGVGTQVVGTAGGYRMAYVPDVSIADGEALVGPAPLPTAAVTGASLEPANVAARIVDLFTYYLFRVEYTTAEALRAQIFAPGGVLPLIDVQAYSNAQWTPGEDIMVRAQWRGATLRMRVWPASVAEPAVWHAEATDTTYLGPGSVGLRNGASAGNTNVPATFGYSAWAVTAYDARFHGQVSSWRPRQDLGGDAWTEIVAGGLLRRLEQGKTPLKSPIFREATDPAELAAMVGYWPCEDGGTATQLASGLADGSPMRIVGELNLAASADVFTGSQPLPELGATGIGPGRCNPYAGTGEIAFRGLFSFPSAGLANGTILMEQWQAGSAVVARWRLVYGTASGGTLQLVPIGPAGTAVESPTAVAYGLNGARFMLGWNVSDVAGTAHWATFGRRILDDGEVEEGGFDADFTTVVPADIGVAGDLYVAQNRDMAGCVVGHLMVGSSVALVSALDQAIVGYQGELAGERFLRLCAQEGIVGALVGELGDTIAMGPQRTGTFLDQCKEIERTDGGLLFEARNDRVLLYRNRVSLYNQTPVLTLDFAGDQIQEPIEPDLDDQNARNDITVKRADGSFAKAVQEVGPLNVQEPEDDPQGIGRYETEVDVNPETDAQLPDLAHWRLRLGTVAATRYATVIVDVDKVPAARHVDIGDLITIDNLDPDPVGLIAIGSVETIGAKRRLIAFNCIPADGYTVAEVDGTPRVDTDGSELAGGIDADDTSLSVSPTAPHTGLWVTGTTITNPTDFPMDVVVGGERMTVTEISGSSAPQTFTVTRSVNGIVKAHGVGAAVNVAEPAYAAL